MSVVNVTAENFEKEVLQAEQMVLVDFWAEWCGPCKMLSPIVDQVAEELPDVKVCKVNVDEQPSLAAEYKVMSIPMLLVFQGGEMINQTVGVQSKGDIKAMLS